jgi:DNA-binding XRE family transcriptional regulator
VVDPAPPVSTNRGDTPPSAPIEGRARGRPAKATTPISTNREAPAQLATLLHAPGPEDIKATRVAAGHTQVQAAAAVGLNRWQTWSDYEGGKHAMPALAWTWYLLVTGAHPVAVLRKKPKPKR